MNSPVIADDEETIIGRLKSRDPRDYLDVATELAKQTYDSQRLTTLAIERGVYSKLGFLAQMVYSTLLRAGFSGDMSNLQDLFLQTQDGTSPLRHLVEGFSILEFQRDKTPIHERWRIVTSLDEDELSDVLQYRIGSGNGSKEN